MLEDPFDSKSLLYFPTIILYPLESQSDLITAFPESASIKDQIDDIFQQSPDWDTNNVYSGNSISVFMETKVGGLLQVGKNLPLGEIIRDDRIVIQDNIVRLLAVPKTEVSQWVKQWKVTHGL